MMTQKNSLKDTLVFILWAYLASWLMQAVLFPDIIFHARRLCIIHETQIPLESTYALVSQFFHGGIQLWDRYDEVNNAYFVFTNGIYGVANILTALIFIVLSPFFAHPGEALYHVHMLFFYGITGLVRTIGGYLLLRKLTSDKAVIFVSLLCLNTILTSYMMAPGIMSNGTYSFLPLLMYTLLCFFEDPRLRSFLMFVVVMCLCLVSSPYFALGYQYEVVHFFGLSCLIGFLWQKGWKKLRGRLVLAKKERVQNIWVMLICGVVVLPYYFWQKALMHDFYIHGSGIGGTHGRFNNILNFKAYFDMFGKGFANSFQFIGTALDYHHNVWGTTWLFIGGTCLFLTAAALLLSRDRRKYLFAATIACIMLINNAWFQGNFANLQLSIQYADLNTYFWARGMHNDFFTYALLMLSTLVHAINAATNPFCFLVRSFHMTSILISLVFFPLVAMGLEACLCLWQRREDLIYFNRRWLLIGLAVLVLIWDLCGGPKGLCIGLSPPGEGVEGLKAYILNISSIFLVFVTLPEFFRKRQWMGWLMLACLFVVDLVGLVPYSKLYNHDPEQITPIRLNTAYTRQALLPDFQNPLLLPVREYIDAQGTAIFPVIDGGPLCMYGAFYQYTPIGRYFHPWSIYEARHISYRDLYPDLDIQRYLMSNPRAMFLADYGVDARQVGLSSILASNVPNRVVTVEAQWYNKEFLTTAGRIELLPPHEQPKIYSTLLDASQARLRPTAYGWEYSYDLPKDFPSFLSTTIFTYDHSNWRLDVGARTLEAAQGRLSAPWTFDVQNLHPRTLTMLLPRHLEGLPPIKLQAKLPQGMLGVWKNTYDDLGFSYLAEKSGWLVFHEPYDPKWDISIDGKKVPVSLVNRYFIGTPITAGRHEILLRYWPHTLLRPLMLLSIVLSCLLFFGIFIYALKREPISVG